MKRVALAAGLLLLFPPAMPGQPLEGKPQLEKRLASVGRLIEESSVSRQIEASGDARALERRGKARDAYRQALQARDAGDYAAAARWATQSSKLMFEAAKLAARDQAPADRRRADFDAQMQNVRSLLAALQRISAEKQNPPETAETSRSIEKLMAEASALSASHRQEEAGAALNKAYLAAKAAVSSMRGGETLVRSLDFATPEEEYRYEIDRNDTHMILIKVLAAEKTSVGSGRDGMPKKSVDRAAELRGQAEKAAGGGDYAGAIELLEGSTRELVRAIRSLGVFIPG